MHVCYAQLPRSAAVFKTFKPFKSFKAPASLLGLLSDFSASR
jgi:hypothetical protein